MMSRNLRITLLISLGVHILAMSIVTIVAPEGAGRMRPYPRVDFLGPILRKTAFDIMIESINPVAKTTYWDTDLMPQSAYLEVAVSKREFTIQEFPQHLENSIDALVIDFLEDSKIVPDFISGFKRDDFMVKVRD